MMRKLIETVLFLMLMILPAHQSALGDVMRGDELHRTLNLTRTNAPAPVYGYQRNTGAGGLQQSQPELTLRGSSFYDAATRLADAAGASPSDRSQFQNVVDGGAGSAPNRNAMLIVGLGIALISIVRRIGRI